MAVLEEDIAWYLTHPGNGLQTAARVDARRKLGDQIGRNIFLGRIQRLDGDQLTDHPFRLYLHRVATRRWADVPGEPTEAQAIIQFTITGKDAPTLCQELCEKYIRLALNNYRGTLGKDDAGYIEGSNVERDGMPRPGMPIDATDKWRFAYSMDIRFTYTQTGI